MPAVTDAVRAQSKSPDEQQIAGSTCMTQCLYNIPPGVITATLPGLGVLAIGLVCLGLTLTAADRSNLADGLPQLAVITVAVGAGWMALALGFWVVWCLRCGLRSSGKTRTRKNSQCSVQLVAVSWGNDALYS